MRDMRPITVASYFVGADGQQRAEAEAARRNTEPVT
jgi:hypothetical protein